jgi:superfamily I DNA and RNA helicase
MSLMSLRMRVQNNYFQKKKSVKDWNNCLMMMNVMVQCRFPGFRSSV